MGGSNLCFDFGSSPGLQEIHREYIAYEVLFSDETSLIANTSYCYLDVWIDGLLHGRDKGSFHKIDARLKIENPEFFKIYINREHQAWFDHRSRVNLIMLISCPNRKLMRCIQFQEGKELLPLQRRLLSVGTDDLYLHRNPNKGPQPLQTVIMLIAGVVLLVIAGSLCSVCNKDRDNLSESGKRAQILSYHERLPSQYESMPREQKVQQETVLETKDDVVVERAERIESLNVENHVALYDELTVSVQHVAPQSVEDETFEGVNHVPDNEHQEQRSEHNVQSSEKHVQSSEKHLSSSEQNVQSSAQHVSSSEQHAQGSVQHVPGGALGIPPSVQSSVQHVSSTAVNHMTEDEKKKRSSKHEHDQEEHKGRFWKRTRSSKKSAASTDTKRTSDTVLRAEEEQKHHDRRSKKGSKEHKGKAGKPNERKSSSESEERKPSDEHRTERPREKTPTLDRHSRGLPTPPLPPAPPGSHGHTLPDRPLPERQSSAPDGTGLEEDNNYEIVERRKTRSVENIDLATDEKYDAVRIEVEKPRTVRSAVESINVERPDSWRGSDIYEIVEETSQAEDLYDEVENSKKENSEKDEDEDPEDPYSRIKKLKEMEVLENLELYEEVDTKPEIEVTSPDQVVVNIDKESIRNRCKSDTAGLQKPNNEFIRRCHTIDVVRERQGVDASSEGKVSNALVDYLYAKVDLSKKKKRLAESHTGEEWSDDNPPPLPPVYISSKQIQIEMGTVEGAEDSLYDEVAPSSSDNTPLLNNDFSVPDTSADEDKRLSAASGYYELVEVKHEVPTVDGNYTGIVDEGPRPKSNSSGRAEPVHVDSSSTLACASSAVIDSNGTVEGEDEDGAPHYEIVTPRRTEKKVSKTTHVAWI